MSNPVTKTSMRQVLYEAAKQICCQSTPCKVGITALGILLIGVATVMYFSQTNAIATYTAFGSSGALILIAALAAFIDYTREDKSSSKDTVAYGPFRG